MSNIAVVAKILCKPDKEQEALVELKKMLEPTRKEPGCIKYVLHRVLERMIESDGGSSDEKFSGKAAEYWFVEEWESKQALDRHMQTPHFLSLCESLPEFTLSSEVIVLAPIE